MAYPKGPVSPPPGPSTRLDDGSGSPAADGMGLFRVVPVEAPSGRQFVLAAHDQELVAVEVGGGIRTYRAGGREVLDGYAEAAMCDGGRGQILCPWPNRLEDGSFEWEGRSLQTPLTEPEHHNSIHGLVRWSAWNRAEPTGESLRLVHRLHPQPGWIWTLDLMVTYRLSAEGLTVTTGVTNRSSSPCPVGLGWHPYVAARGLVDDLTLTLPASTELLSDERGLPTTRRAVDGALASGHKIGTDSIDRAFTDLARDAAGRARVSTDIGVSLWMDRTFRWVMVYTGDTLSDPARRRRGLAIEPMTAPPNMLRSGEDMIVLRPAEHLEASWGIDPFS